MRKAILAAFMAGLSNLASAGTVYYLDIVNTAPSSMRSFEVARAGSDRFHPVEMGDVPLQGGGASTTIAIRKGDDGCLRDVRVNFVDGRSVIHRDFNICKIGSYHAGLYLREHNQVASAGLP